mgnify:CR=1 FL=1
MNTHNEIIEYIKSKEYVGALLVTGKWGSGKSYLIKEIAEVVNNSYNDKDFNGIHRMLLISLFDVDSIEMLEKKIKNAILFQTYNLEKKNHNIDMFANGFKQIFNFIGQATGKSGLTNAALSINIYDFINIDSKLRIKNPKSKKNCLNAELILVFDDFERCSIQKSILVGILNEYLENKNIKTIIVADENKINEPEYKEYKEQERKNIEVAVELDRPELYERYLSMKFRDFMDWYWNVNGAKELGKRMPVPDRIYVGNAFCHLLFPEKRQLFEILKKAESEGLAVTVTFSYLREFMLKPVENLLDELEEWCRNRETFPEIAANDWGLLEILRERKEWKEEKEVLVPCMGTLLNKRKKDPRMGYKQGETGYFRENSLNAEFYRTYLRDTFGIRRYEWEPCGYRQKFPEGKNSIHVPFYQTNTSQYCTLYAVCKNGERGKQELPESCPGYCREKVFLYPKHLKMAGRYNSLFALDGSAVSGMMDMEMWKKQGIDRLVVNLL